MADPPTRSPRRSRSEAPRWLRFAERDLGEPLSIFALTAAVQRVALDLAEARGVSPDRFRYEEDPRREAAFESIGF